MRLMESLVQQQLGIQLLALKGQDAVPRQHSTPPAATRQIW